MSVGSFTYMVEYLKKEKEHEKETLGLTQLTIQYAQFAHIHDFVHRISQWIKQTVYTSSCQKYYI
jgi:hypothetical protein